MTSRNPDMKTDRTSKIDRELRSVFRDILSGRVAKEGAAGRTGAFVENAVRERVSVVVNRNMPSKRK